MKKIFATILMGLLACAMLGGCKEKGQSDDLIVKVGSLKGPTSIGLVKLMDDAEKGLTDNRYEFTMAVTADELLPKMISGDLDIALVPANVASGLCNKTDGGVVAVDINTLGVLYAVSGDDSISSISDLAGKTIFVTNKGTTPDYAIQYLLTSNGLSVEEVTLEYKSEATEVAACLKENPEAVGILPQPFVTVACAQNEELSAVLDLTKEWDGIQTENGSRLVTGVTIVRKDFFDNNEKAVKAFMEDHKNSAEYVNTNVDDAANLVVNLGIIEKATIAAKAIPNCNITYIDGEDMKKALSGYLEVLYSQDASSIGGTLPGEEFYY